jgi:D-sedoheptulose 7-phosphate isomerase
VQDQALTLVRRHLAESQEALARSLADAAMIAATVEIAALIERALRAGGKVLLIGNGGSAADAQHFAGELVSRFKFDRAPLAALALTTDSSVLTAIANDYGYEQAFARQVRGLGQSGDVLIAISTSGRSPSILRAVEAANERGLHTVAFTGANEAPLAQLCGLALLVPSTTTALIQQIHITIAHAICEIVENALFGDARQADRTR